MVLIYSLLLFLIVTITLNPILLQGGGPPKVSLVQGSGCRGPLGSMGSEPPLS